jgi:hypothetical protein
MNNPTAAQIETTAAAAQPVAIDLLKMGLPAAIAIEMAALLTVFVDANDAKISQALTDGENPEEVCAALMVAFQGFAVKAAAQRRS